MSAVFGEVAVALKSCSTFDLVVTCYAILVTIIIISYRRSKHNHRKVKGHKFHFVRSPPKGRVGGSEVNATAGSNTFNVDWKKQFEGKSSQPRACSSLLIITF